MATRITRKSVKQDEFIERAFDVGQWIERHWRESVLAVAGALLLVAVFAGWSWFSHRRSAELGQLLAQGLDAYGGRAGAQGATGSPTETGGRFAEALPIFERVAREAGNSTTGDVARYYQGATLLRMNRAPEAIPLFERVAARAGDRILAGSARAMLAEALLAAGNADKAIETYRGLSAEPQGSYPPDMALLRMAQILRGQGKTKEASQILQDLVTKHPQGAAATEARALLQKGKEGAQVQ